MESSSVTKRIEIVPSSQKLMLFGRRGRRPKTGGSAVKADRCGGAPGLHKRGTSAEDWGGGRTGRAALSLDGTGGFPPYSSQRGSTVRCPHQAVRPQHQRAEAGQ